MRKWLLGLTAAAGIAATADGQTPPAGTVAPPPVTYPQTGSPATFPAVPTPPPGGYAPNVYDRSRQPLSPYLNLFRGISPAVDYYYGVRPGSAAGRQTYGAGFGVPTTAPAGGSRFGYLPLQAATAEQGVEIPAAGVPLQNNQLFQTGHPVTFGVGPGRVGPGAGSSRPGFTRSPVGPPQQRR